MQPFYCVSAAFAVAILYLFYRTYRQVMIRRQRQLRARVAYMLWVMANQPESDSSLAAR